MRFRLVALLVSVSCTHAQPPGPPPQPDAVSPITAAGSETPHDLDWKPEVYGKPAAEVFKNVTVLGEVRAGRFMAGMQSMKPSIGLKCIDCHDKGDYKGDTHPQKESARRMLQMNGRIDEMLFKGEPKVTCWMCHQGEAKPTAPPLTAVKPAAPDPPLAELSEADAQKPAEEVYKNIQHIKGVKAGRLPQIMGWFTGALGVRCDHCHVPGKWELDEKPQKQRAREMLQMVGMTAREFYKGPTPVHCAMCHRGQPKPQAAPALAQAGN